METNHTSCCDAWQDASLCARTSNPATPVTEEAITQKMLPGKSPLSCRGRGLNRCGEHVRLPSVRADVIHPAVEISPSDIVTLRQVRKPKGGSK